MKSKIKTECAILIGGIDGHCNFLISHPDCSINQKLECLNTIKSNAKIVFSHIQNSMDAPDLSEDTLRKWLEVHEKEDDDD